MPYKNIPQADSADRLLDRIENCIKTYSVELEQLKEQYKHAKWFFKRRRLQERITEIEKYLRFARIQEKSLSYLIFGNH